MASLRSSSSSSSGDDGAAGTSKDKDLAEQILEKQRREYMLLSKLAETERKMQTLRNQANMDISAFEEKCLARGSLQRHKVDPVVLLELAGLQQRSAEKSKEIEKLQGEVQTTMFDPRSINGQKLLKRCRHLLDENQELAKQLGEELLQDCKILVLAEEAKHKELKNTLAKLSERAEVVDAENEKMQEKIAALGRQCRERRTECDELIEQIDNAKRVKTAA